MTDHSLDSDRALASQAIPAPAATGDQSLVYESGLEVETRSQWTYARRRFMRHRLAVASLIVLILILGSGAFASWVAPYPYDGIDLENAGVGPTFDNWHLFGTDLLGRDYFSRVIYGIQTSEKVAFIVALLAVLIGTAVGALSGYYSGWVDNGLMRFTDLMLTLPGLAVLLTAAAFLGHGSPYRVAVILGFLLWTALARLVRGQFLSLREKDYIDAAKAAGAGDYGSCFGTCFRTARADHRVRHADDRTRHPARGSAFVPRLRNPAPDPRARVADRTGTGRIHGHVVARPVPRAYHRRSSCSASTSWATACATRSTRPSGYVPEPVLSIKDLTVEFNTEDGIVHAVDGSATTSFRARR